MQIDRFKTFSPVFDEILGGGFPRPCLALFDDRPSLAISNLVASKVVFPGMEKGEIGIYLAFDHSPTMIREHARLVGMDIGKYEKSGKCFIIDGFRWGDEKEKLSIKDPSNDSEVIGAFSAIRDEASGDLKNNCRCIVDSTVSLYYVHGAEKLVSFALLLREASHRLGISTILMTIGGIGAHVNNVLGYNSDVVLEFETFEVSGNTSHKMRVSRAFTHVSPSPWLEILQNGDDIMLKTQ